MTTDNNVLKYTDETDKCFGLAGMCIALFVWDAESLLRGVNVDAPAEEGIEMQPDFYLELSPRLGAKAAWEQSLLRFRLTTAMMVGNLACRKISRFGHSALEPIIDCALREFLNEEGKILCQLDADEVSTIYGKTLMHSTRVFRHEGVTALAQDLAEEIAKHRVLSNSDVLELLSAINRM